jgi:DNA-binding NarL/FixJ family response regulator
MSSESPLKDKVVLVVDDEPDVVESVADELQMCLIHKAFDFDSARQLLVSYSYDIVILDIMGVNGFELLKESVYRGFPTVMFTAHALTPEALKTAIELGALSFLPKEELPNLKKHLEDVVLGEGKPVWQKVFTRLSLLFGKRFGPDWKERDEFFKKFEKEIMSSFIQNQ